MNTLSGIIRFLVFAIGSLVLVPLAWVIRQVTGRVHGAKLFHRMACAAFGIKIHIYGHPSENADTPTVFLSNHLSYLDIVVLGSLIEARFVAKAEVAGWPVFGAFSKVQRTIFIERTRQALENAKGLIAAVLKTGSNVILFGEGTSTDGRKVLPFKAGLLEMLYEDGVNAQLQPIAIVIESVGGKSPDDQTVRDGYAWWKPEDTLAPHLWNLAKIGGAVIGVHYLPVLDPKQFPDRKALSHAATTAVANILTATS